MTRTGSQHIVITGASSGIGAALMRALASEGHRIYACARRAERLEALTSDTQGVSWRVCDVSQEEQVRGFVAWVREQILHVDALINCAGHFGAIGPVLKTDSRQWLSAIEVNLYGTYLMVKHLAPLMGGARQSRIVNFSGGGAFGPFANYSAYAVSKAGVVRLTEILALELAAQGITVNAVAPGFVATELHEATLRCGPELAGPEFFDETQRLLRKDGVPIEVPVACVKFLLSDQAAALTGKTISASFDPWDRPAFVERIAQINASEVYTLRRMNLVNLPESELRRALTLAQQSPEAMQPKGALA